MQFVFLKEHLIGDHYSPADDSSGPAYSGEPGRRSFDQNNSGQVLYIINCLGDAIGKLTITDARKLEAFILKQLPAGIKSEKAVFNWLREIYLYHWV